MFAGFYKFQATRMIQLNVGLGRDVASTPLYCISTIETLKSIVNSNLVKYLRIYVLSIHFFVFNIIYLDKVN